MRVKATIAWLCLTLFSLLCSYLFYSVTKSELNLYQVGKTLTEINDEEKYISSNQRLKSLNQISSDLENADVKGFNSERYHRAKSIVESQLSEIAIWNKQRNIHSEAALKAIQSAVLINPYSIRNWSLALDLQWSQDSSSSDINWILSNLLERGRWSDDSRLYAGYYCIWSWHQLSADVLLQCANALRSLNEDTLSRNKILNAIKKQPALNKIFIEALNYGL